MEKEIVKNYFHDTSFYKIYDYDPLKEWNQFWESFKDKGVTNFKFAKQRFLWK